jgi:hypothetical protein
VRQLHVLGVSEDGAALLLGTSKNAAKPTHRIPLDDRLVRATRGQLAVNGDRAESALTPKEYQARMRAGASPEEVAKVAGVPVARVMPYFAPVEAERDRIVDEARATIMRRSRGQDGTRPLGESVDAHLAAVAGIKDESVTWTARRRGDGAWIVAVSYAARGGRRKAEWLWQSVDKVLSPLDAAAARLGVDLPVGSVKRRTTRTTARPAAKKATRKAAPRKAAAKKAAPAKRAATKKAALANRAVTATRSSTVKKAASVRTAVAAKKAGVRKAATGATRAAPVAKKAARKPAPVVKRAVRKPAPKPAVRKRTRPPVVAPAPAPAPVLEPVVELVPPPAPEPVERPRPKAPAAQAPAAQAPAAQAPAAQAPAAPARKPGQRVPLPSWSEVLLGVTGKHDDGGQANGGGSGGRRAG